MNLAGRILNVKSVRYLSTVNTFRLSSLLIAVSHALCNNSN